ncbi:MAG: cation:proton antiporter, partial [Acetobacteraceae bacterium]|nr:cation:proton antiporter [Acetobacteraceae bacterium]
MFSLLDLAASLLVLSTIFEWLNKRYLALPSSIGLLGMGLIASLLFVAVGTLFPGHPVLRRVVAALQSIDFESTVMNGLLAFLLFAGALHLDVGNLRGRAVPVAMTATVGVLISTAFIGGTIWLASSAIGHAVALPWALVFGALISPTDPVAVLGTLKAVKVPQELETDMAGESLFNDGVGVVVFTLLLAIASGQHASAGGVALLFLREAIGGACLGFVTGWIGFQMTRRVDEYTLEVMLSLALATGTYALAQAIDTSGPIAV